MLALHAKDPSSILGASTIEVVELIMNKMEIKDYEVKKISEEEFKQMQETESENTIEISYEQLKAEQEFLKEHKSGIDKLVNLSRIYLLMLFGFIVQNIILVNMLYTIYMVYTTGEGSLGFHVLCTISVIVVTAYVGNSLPPYKARWKNARQIKKAYNALVAASDRCVNIFQQLEDMCKEERADKAEELAEPITLAVAELWLARQTYERTLDEGRNL